MNEMEFKSMSEIEIAIKKIENVKMINIYELTGARLEKGTTGCVAIAITYGKNQQLNLTEGDEGFQSLVYKVYEIYNKNKDIMMDESTRALLESGASFGMEKELKPYYQIEEEECPAVSSDSVLSQRFISIIEYLVDALYQLFDMNVKVIKRESGWRGACLLEVDVDGNGSLLYGKVTKISNQHYAISITNFLKNQASMLVNVRIGFGEFDISFQSDQLHLNGTFTYDYKEGKLIERKEIEYENKTVYYDTKEYDSEENIYQLPFQLQYRIINKCIVSEDVETTHVCGQYSWMDGAYVEITGWTEVLNPKKNIRLKMHSLHLQKILLKDGNWQTYFYEVEGHTSERYRKQLQGKYFIR